MDYDDPEVKARLEKEMSIPKELELIEYGGKFIVKPKNFGGKRSPEWTNCKLIVCNRRFKKTESYLKRYYPFCRTCFLHVLHRKTTTIRKRRK